MRENLMVKLVLACMAFFCLYSEACAWGDKAHQVICGVALEIVRPDTKVEIERLIAKDPKFESFAESCVFPDHPRIRAPEHFVNLARNASELATDECPEANTCVLSAIRKDTQILSSKREDDFERLAALKSLGHWVGDVHQPLHVSFEDDRGGNRIPTSGQCRDLHAAWDSCLVLYSIGPDTLDAWTSLFK